jgi:hypothetical protein
MAEHRVLLALAALALAGVGTWVLVSSTSRPLLSSPVKLPVERAGVRISEIPPGFRSSDKAVSAQPRDWLVETEQLRFVVGAEVPGMERQIRLGNLLDVAVDSIEDDDLRDVRTVLNIGSKSIPTRVSGLTLAPHGSAPVVRVQQHSHDGRIELDTDYEVVPGKSIITITTRVFNATDQLIRSVQVGDRTLWPGEPTFAPRAGFVKFTSHSEVPWVGREGHKLSYVLDFAGQHFDASFLFDRIGPLGQVTLSSPRDLLPRESFEVKRELIVAQGGLDTVAELAWRRSGREVGWVEGTLEPAPSWATVEARYPDNKPALSVRVAESGRYRLALPPGDYRLVLKSSGGEDQEEVSIESERLSNANLLPPRPGMLRFSITDTDQAPIAARIQVRGIAPSKDPDFGPVETAVGAGNVVYTASGSGFIELPAGRYRVIVGHGTEYSMVEQEVQIAEDEGAALHVTLGRVVDTTGYLACDFHVHADPSHDSQITLDDRVTSLVGEGIEFVAATDHDHVTDYAPIIARLDYASRLKSATGVEITTSTWGHFNAYPYPLGQPPPEHAGRAPGEIFATVRARAPGAVIQVNHPRMPGVGYFNRIELDSVTGAAQSEGFSFDFDAIESSNGYDLENPKVLDENLREYFGLLNTGRRFSMVGNSDSHRLITNWVGHPRTYVRVADDRPEAVTPEDVARQVLGGHVTVSNGIFLFVLANGMAGPGDTIAESRITLQISARAPEWVGIKRIEVFANGALAAKRELATSSGRPVRVDWQVDFDNQGDTWYAVVARGDQPMTLAFPGRRVLPFGFTNPIFVDADQDGVFRAINETAPPATDLPQVPLPAPEPTGSAP